MLTLVILLFIVLFLSNINSYLFTLSLFTILVFFLSTSPISFNTSLVSDFYMLYDEISIFLILLLFIVLFLSFYHSPYSEISNNNTLVVSLFCIFISCFLVFSTSNMFLLYFFYEASLVPIVIIIIKWGSYPERSLSSVMIAIYTLVFTVPMFLILIYTYLNSFTFSIFFIPTLDSSLMSLLVFLCFAVNLPIYGLHYWLPIAHVEAPTFGSVILASVLLKLGGVGLFRSSSFINITVLSDYLLSYLIIFLIFSTLVCCFQSDINRLVAYSSVSHIIVVPFLFLSNNFLSVNALILCIMLHGLISSMLFIIVGLIYSIYSTRQLILIRGLSLTSPVLSFISVLCFFYTLSAPPFPTFIMEIYFIISSYFLTNFLAPVFLIFAFLSLVYNLNWLVSLNMSSYVSSSHSFHVFYRDLAPFALLFVYTFIFTFYIHLC